MVKVLIERLIAEGLEKNYEQTIIELLNHAEKSPGYLGGESFKDAQSSNRYIVVSSWESVNAWKLWFGSSQRMEMLNKIGMFLKQPERFTVLEPCIYQVQKTAETA